MVDRREGVGIEGDRGRVRWGEIERNRHQEQRNSGGGGRSRGRIREVGREVSGAAVRLN